MRDVAHLGPVACAAILGAAAALGVVQSGHAQGFSVYEHGSCAMARAGATVAVPCNDGSSIYFNPAGLAGAKGGLISVGTTVVAAGGEWVPNNGSPSELQNDPILVPHAYLTYGLSERLTLGLGTYVPYGLGTKWDPEFEGHHLGYDNNLQSIYIQPTAAYQLTSRLSLGAGLTVVQAAIELNQRLDVSEQMFPLGNAAVPFTVLGAARGTDFGEGRLEGSGTGIGGNFGIQFKATDRLSIGARYTTKVDIDYEGDANFEQIGFDPSGWKLQAALSPNAPAGTPISLIPAGPGVTLAQAIQAGVAAQFTGTGKLVNQTIKASLSMPAQLVVGLGVKVTPSLLLLADYQWTEWSSFDQIQVDFETAPDLTRYELFKNTHAFRVGTEYASSDALRLRAGVLTHSAAAPDEVVTPLLPEAKRIEYTVGAGLRLSRVFELNAAYQYLNQSDREGRVQEAPTGEVPTTALNTGMYRFNAHLFGMTLTAHF